MNILSSIEIADALTFNSNRNAFQDPGLINRIQDFLDLDRNGRIDTKLVEAVAAWQMRAGLVVDGKIGRNTERSLRAAMSSAPSPLHPIPPITKRWNYDHAELESYPYHDTHLEAITNTDTWAAGMIRLVAGYRKGSGTFSRGLDSFITLDTYSLGIAHWWAASAPELLANIAQLAPDVAAWAWGEETAKVLTNEEWLRNLHPPKRGKRRLTDELKWLLAGWWACARHPAVAYIQCEMWFEEYVGRARRVAHRLDWDDELSGPDGGKILAALARAANSGRGVSKIRPFIGSGSALSTLERFYLADREATPSGYEKPDRWDKIESWSNFSGPAPAAADVLVDGLDFAVTPKRHGKTNPPAVSFPTDADTLAPIPRTPVPFR